MKSSLAGGENVEAKLQALLFVDIVELEIFQGENSLQNDPIQKTETHF